MGGIDRKKVSVNRDDIWYAENMDSVEKNIVPRLDEKRRETELGMMEEKVITKEDEVKEEAKEVLSGMSVEGGKVLMGEVKSGAGIYWKAVMIFVVMLIVGLLLVVVLV